MMCLRGHSFETETIFVNESPFVDGTALILRKCKKCNFKDAWARPPFQDPFPLDVNWAEKTFFTVRK